MIFNAFIIGYHQQSFFIIASRRKITMLNIFKVTFISLHGFFFKIYHFSSLFLPVDSRLVLFLYFRLMPFYMSKQRTMWPHLQQPLHVVPLLSFLVPLVNFWVEYGWEKLIQQSENKLYLPFLVSVSERQTTHSLYDHHYRLNL